MHIDALRPRALVHRTLVAQRAHIALDVRHQRDGPAHHDCRLAARGLERAAHDGARRGAPRVHG
jgi:hypothetical protein